MYLYIYACMYLYIYACMYIYVSFIFSSPTMSSKSISNRQKPYKQREKASLLYIFFKIFVNAL